MIDASLVAAAMALLNKIIEALLFTLSSYVCLMVKYRQMAYISN
jgi:hypothetical protein